MAKPPGLPAAAALALAALCGAPAMAQNLIGVHITEPGQSAVAKTVTLGIDKSTVIDLPRPAADVVITNADIADAVVQSRQRIIFRGVATGATNAFIFDDQGREILNLEISVEPDLSALNALLKRHLPETRVTAEAANGSIILTGAVASVAESEQVIQLVGLYGGQDVDIVNMLSVAAKDQVLLEVRVVEMQRSYLKQLGLDPQLDISLGDDLAEDVDLSAGFNPTLTDGGFQGSAGYTNFVNGEVQLNANLDIAALERIGIARTLAEPNITAVSGESATFLAGGEVPVPTLPDEDGRIGFTFKQFGVGLGFTPVVLSENRISLRVSTEVSELSSEGSVGGVPGLTVRRVNSTIELPSGRSMMLAGLIQSRTRQDLDKVPGLKNLPVLGQLFQSRDFSNEETELVILITPYLVDPTTRRALRTPADGFANAGDSETLLFGRLNAMYADGKAALSPESYSAPVGFIEE